MKTKQYKNTTAIEVRYLNKPGKISHLTCKYRALVDLTYAAIYEHIIFNLNMFFYHIQQQAKYVLMTSFGAKFFTKKALTINLPHPFITVV